ARRRQASEDAAGPHPSQRVSGRARGRQNRGGVLARRGAVLPKFGVSQVTLNLGGKIYSDGRPKSADAGGSWTVVIPLSLVDSASLSRDGAEPQSFAMAAFSD